MKTARLSTCELISLYNDRSGGVNGNRQNAVASELLRRGIISVEDYYCRPMLDCRYCAPDEACAFHVGAA